MEKSTESEILELERSYWKAMQDNDVEKCVALSDDPCIVSGAQGVSSINRESFRRMMKNAPYSLNGFDLKDEVVRVLNDDMAVLAYTVHEDLTANGEDVSLDAAESSTWIRRDGKWLCTAHSESLIGDPFGRDRKAAEKPDVTSLSPEEWYG